MPCPKLFVKALGGCGGTDYFDRGVLSDQNYTMLRNTALIYEEPGPHKRSEVNVINCSK